MVGWGLTVAVASIRDRAATRARGAGSNFTPDGTKSVQFSLAVDRRWTDQGGQPQERTTRFRATAWGRLAETLEGLAQSGALAKGQQVYVQGRLEPREYQDRQGTPRASLDVRAAEVQLLGSRPEGEAAPVAPGRSRGTAATGGPPADEGPDAGLDDVPF
jgi:single-strand DNA-binding protein